jgi:hypothetical protein
MSDLASFRGVVHGRTIELDYEPGLADGQEVTVVLQPAGGSTSLPPGEGIRRSAGGWGDDTDGVDEYLNWTRQQRKVARQPQNSACAGHP